MLVRKNIAIVLVTCSAGLLLVVGLALVRGKEGVELRVEVSAPTRWQSEPVVVSVIDEEGSLVVLTPAERPGTYSGVVSSGQLNIEVMPMGWSRSVHSSQPQVRIEVGDVVATTIQINDPGAAMAGGAVYRVVWDVVDRSGRRLDRRKRPRVRGGEVIRIRYDGDVPPYGIRMYLTKIGVDEPAYAFINWASNGGIASFEFP